MTYRQFNLAPRNRAAAIALVVAAIMVGGIVLALGLTLLLGVATVAVVGGLGVMLYHRLMRLLRGGRAEPRGERLDPSLDPSMEVFPAQSSSRPLRPRNTD